MGAMAVLIASDLQKDVGGGPLLRGVSFKLERRERMTIAGRTGSEDDPAEDAAGEESIDRESSSSRRARGSRCMINDLRAPAAPDGWSRCGSTSYRGVQRSSRSRQSSPASAGWDRGDRRCDAREVRSRPGPPGGQGGYLWRDRATTMIRGVGFKEEDLDRGLDTSPAVS